MVDLGSGLNILTTVFVCVCLNYHDELQAMEEHRVCQARIVDALEAEKRKISKELEELQKKRTVRETHTPRNGKV